MNSAEFPLLIFRAGPCHWPPSPAHRQGHCWRQGPALHLTAGRDRNTLAGSSIGKLTSTHWYPVTATWAAATTSLGSTSTTWLRVPSRVSSVAPMT